MAKRALWAAAFTLLACGSSEPLFDGTDPDASVDGVDGNAVCIPGRQITCACPGGEVGAQACRDDGKGYLACDCSDGAGGGHGEGPGDAGVQDADSSTDSGNDAHSEDADVQDADNSTDSGNDAHSEDADVQDADSSTDSGSDAHSDAGSEDRDGGNECIANSQKAERMPLDIHIMLDKSGSMAWNNNGGSSTSPTNPARWTSVTNALKAFVNDAGSAGMGVGLQYFPQSQTCSVPAYRTPNIPIQLLPLHASAIETSLNSTSPNGGTPTRPALEGALEYSKEWSDQHPGHTVIVVLATDGEPDGGCTNNGVNAIATLASQYKDDHGIKTFVIGIGNSTGNLNTIATAGGTGEAFMVIGSNAEQGFIEAMNDIRAQARPCEYALPAGGPVDDEKVAMRFTADGGTTMDIDYIGQASGCGTEGGWFYDDKLAPTKIVVCPVTCEMFKADAKGQVDLLLGCTRQ